MTEQLIDLTRIDFWAASIVALIFLAPLSAPPARQAVFAFLNAGFIALLLKWHALFILLAVPITWALLHGLRGRRRVPLVVITSCLVAALFLLHKLPQASGLPALDPIRSGLSVIGFSYVALRIIELVRAVFEGRHDAPQLFDVVNFLLPFHMLAAGPIQSYDEFVAGARAERQPLTTRTALDGAERIVTGLFKKFVLAYALQQAFLTDFETGGPYFLFEVQIFFLWLFLDFSAYSDIAIGIGRLMGVATPENFNKPYLARNAIDFWDRWHISLSMFIRRNIFIPIQLHLTRRSDGRHPLLTASIAFTIAFILCGLWHGLTLNFLLWGAIHAGALVIANLWREYLKRRLGREGVKQYLADRRIKWLARFVTYEYVAFSLVVLFFP